MTPKEALEALRSAVGCVSPLAPTVKARAIEALAVLRKCVEDCEGLWKFKASVDEALNTGDGSYRP